MENTDGSQNSLGSNLSYHICVNEATMAGMESTQLNWDTCFL
jgi:hypothetical protein